MTRYIALLAGIAVVCPSNGLTSRSVFRSWPSGNVKLQEFNARGITYGRCFFYNNDEIIELTYEEFNGVLHVRSARPYVADPISKTQACRKAATERRSQDKPESRTILKVAEAEETEEEIQDRLKNFEEEAPATIPNPQSRFFGLIESQKIYRKRTNKFPNFGLGRYSFPTVKFETVGDPVGFRLYFLTP